MSIVDFLELVLKWAWGTMLTAVVMAVLTMFLRHGKRWFRGARKFIRTGRVSKPSARRDRTQPQVQAGVPRAPRFSLTSILQALGQTQQTRRSSTPTTTSTAAPQNDVPLDLKF